MVSCDILIVGGGPAGSSCAWGLRHSGLDVALIDRQAFPRDKVCGGWITPGVLTAREIDPADYGSGRTLQPISAFRTGCIGPGASRETDYGKPVSYGIRRREFDDYLLKRCAARVYEGVSLSRLERQDGGWLANGNIRARLVVGAGGNFCPVAHQLSNNRAEIPVVAQETEFEMDARRQADCPVRGSTPELYFCPDMKGYGWCFRKGNFLNIGLGRADPHGLPEHVTGFLRYLTETRGLALEAPRLRGHAYLLYGTSPRPMAGDGFLLTGDSAGLAYPQSGEGIRCAIESGLLAAECILKANGNYSESCLATYTRRIAERFGGTGNHWASRVGGHLPEWMNRFAAARLLRTGWFVRHMVLDRWFLHS